VADNDHEGEGRPDDISLHVSNAKTLRDSFEKARGHARETQQGLPEIVQKGSQSVSEPERPLSEDVTLSKREQLDLAREELHNRGIESDLKARETYASRIYWLLLGWMAAILLIVIAAGLQTPEKPTVPHLWVQPLDVILILVLLLIPIIAMGMGWTKRLSNAIERNTAMWCWARRITVWVAWAIVPALVALLVLRRAIMIGPTRSPITAWISAFELSENVLLLLVGTTTANVIGLFAIVAKYHFPPASRKDD
jgi:hypothetical protein